MGLTSTLYTSLSGLTTNGQALSVAGNNIANSNTTGYKASRISFETSILQTIRTSSAPTADLGGTNPAQIGFGAQIGSISERFSTGSLQPTGVNTDVAIDGDGFFAVEEGSQRFYTRAGNFQLDRDFNLVTTSGAFVQGLAVDDEFNLINGVETNINIPVGVRTLAVATTRVKLGGNLNSSGDLATQGSIQTTDPVFSDAGATTAATGATALTSLFDDAGTQLFQDGDIIKLSKATKGGQRIADTTFEVGAANTTDSNANGTTMAEMMQFLSDAMGLHTDVSGGVTLSAGGEMLIESNFGSISEIDIEDANLLVTRAGSTSTPFVFNQTQEATGESVRTNFIAYDSLGNQLQVDASFYLDTRDDSGTQWRYLVNSADDTDPSSALTTGVLEFNTNGQLVSSESESFVVDRTNTGAETPQIIELTFVNPEGAISALADVTSQAQTLAQDGSPIGTLTDFSIGGDGTIAGTFSNGLLRPLGQVIIANFANPNGLEATGGSLYMETVNSGGAQIVPPGTASAGRLVGGTLELSNVELAEEFINLINASTGFSANSRVLTTSDELLQELLNVV